MKWIIILLLLPVYAFAQCIEPTDGMIITKSTIFCGSTYDVPNGITIAADNVELDCASSVLRGIVGQSEIGVRVENAEGITVRNCNILTFNQGLYLKNVTNSLIEDNSILKNRIGIRMLDSFENIIRDNNDKSFQVAVSAINSKFNIVMLGNKEIERAFCEENSCNEYRDMNVCESGDFYCSKKCSAETDADCKRTSIAEKPAEPRKSADDIIKEAEEEVRQEFSSEQPQQMTYVPKPSIPVITKILIYAALYIIALIAFRVAKKR